MKPDISPIWGNLGRNSGNYILNGLLMASMPKELAIRKCSWTVLSSFLWLAFSCP